ncbi:MAG TPA: regulatory protein RecX, partial [Cytophagales bacterium]|nr:regulatory protein RecX [Cytophagales bacterium]
MTKPCIFVVMDARALYLKIANYCAYQERSLQDVEAKFKKWEVPEDLHNEFIKLLIEDGYLDQERFVNTYTRGKIYLKKWGKTKIRMYLKNKGIDEDTINNSLSKVDNTDYLDTAKKLALAKKSQLKGKDTTTVTKQKIFRYLLSKGYEADVVMQA